MAVGAVVGHDEQAVAYRGHFLLQHDDVGTAEARDHIHLRARGVQSLSLGVGDGAAHAAAHHGDVREALGLGGFPQGADKIQQGVPLLQGVEQQGGLAHLLEDDGDGAFLRVGAGDGQGNAFAGLVHPQDDELPGLGLAGDEGRLDIHPGDGGIEGAFMDNGIHGTVHSLYSGPPVCIRKNPTILRRAVLPLYHSILPVKMQVSFQTASSCSRSKNLL